MRAASCVVYAGVRRLDVANGFKLRANARFIGVSRGLYHERHRGNPVGEKELRT